MVSRQAGSQSSVYERLVSFLVLAGTAAAVYVGWGTWQSEIERRRVETTLAYLKDLTDPAYVERLWELQRFVMCFEKSAGKNLALLSASELEADRSGAEDLVRRFWRIVELGEKIEGLKTPDDVESKMYFVYSRVSLTASCLAAGLCSQSTFDRMSDAAEIETLLALSHYLMLADGNSVEWNASPDLAAFLQRSYTHFSKRPGFAAGRQRIREKNCSG